MADIVLDTNTIGDFLAQYFNPQTANRGSGHFRPEGMLTKPLADHLNRILTTFRRYEMCEDVESPYSSGLVVASAFAFVELCRNWEKMVGTRFSITQLQQFIIQSPEWFNIAPVDETLLPFYAYIPTDVYMDGGFKAIEWCDAIHAATAESRGAGCFLATTDERLRSLQSFKGRIVI